MPYCLGYSMMEFLVLFQFSSHDVDEKGLLVRYEECNTIGGDNFSLLEQFSMDLVCKILGVLNVMGDLPTYDLRTQASSFAASNIVVPLLDTIALRGMSLVNFGKPIKFCCTCSCRIHLFVKNIIDASPCFDPLHVEDLVKACLKPIIFCL